MGLVWDRFCGGTLENMASYIRCCFGLFEFCVWLFSAFFLHFAFCTLFALFVLLLYTWYVIIRTSEEEASA